MNPFWTDVVFPILGIGIILFCILSFVFSYGEKVRDKIQKIEAFGIHLEVSLLTVFLIIGLVLLFTRVYLGVIDYKGELERYKGELEHYKSEFEKAKRDIKNLSESLNLTQNYRISPIIKLQGRGADNMPKPDEVDCRYYQSGKTDPTPVDVVGGPGSNLLRLELSGIKLNTFIQRLEIEESDSGNIWSLEDFIPLEPIYQLKRE